MIEAISPLACSKRSYSIHQRFINDSSTLINISFLIVFFLLRKDVNKSRPYLKALIVISSLINDCNVAASTCSYNTYTGHLHCSPFVEKCLLKPEHSSSITMTAESSTLQGFWIQAIISEMLDHPCSRLRVEYQVTGPCNLISLVSKWSSTLPQKFLVLNLKGHLSGTHIALFGITNIYSPWTCFIDGKNMPSTPSNNSWELCHNTQSLADGQHSLTVNATSDNQQTLWVDYISYTPSKNVPLDNSWVLFDNLDPDIHYDFGWAKHENVHTTRTKGSSMTFNFTGMIIDPPVLLRLTSLW